MKNNKSIEISVKTVFTGRRSVEQAFVDLIRRRINPGSTIGLELIHNQRYNDIVVFPDVHKASERRICNE